MAIFCDVIQEHDMENSRDSADWLEIAKMIQLDMKNGFESVRERAIRSPSPAGILTPAEFTIGR